MCGDEITAELISASPAAPTPREQLRLAAVSLAVDLSDTGPRDCDGDPLERRVRDALRAAARIYAWITQPLPVARLVGRIGAPTRIPEGPPMPNPQVPVSYSFEITIEPEDTQGNAVGDTLTWTSSDDTDNPVTADTTTLIGTVQVLAPSVGTVITATDGTNTFTYEFDGVADAPVTLVGTVGVPFKTPPATPAV